MLFSHARASRRGSPVSSGSGRGLDLEPGQPALPLEATHIVDLFHARQHLHDLAKFLEFMLGDTREAWLEARSPTSTPATSPRSAPPPAPSP